MAQPDYRKHDPRGWCGDPKRGAALGRYPYHLENKPAFSGRLFLMRIRLDVGGYDKNGTYWGHGRTLYWCSNLENTVDFCFRADDHEAAKKVVLSMYPRAKVS